MIATHQVGRRIIFSGDTFGIKEQIKRLGGHWNTEAGHWWVGSGKKAEVEQLVQSANSQPVYPPQPRDETPYSGPVQGKVSYKSRNYYVVWHGQTRSGAKCKLTPFDGNIIFWADESACQWQKRYGGYGHDFPTLNSLRKFAEARKLEQQDGVPRTRAAIHETIEMLDDQDRFQEAAGLAREHGIAY